jgi:hypothetical protein
MRRLAGSSSALHLRGRRRSACGPAEKAGKHFIAELGEIVMLALAVGKARAAGWENEKPGRAQHTSPRRNGGFCGPPQTEPPLPFPPPGQSGQYWGGGERGGGVRETRSCAAVQRLARIMRGLGWAYYALLPRCFSTAENVTVDIKTYSVGES